MLSPSPFVRRALACVSVTTLSFLIATLWLARTPAPHARSAGQPLAPTGSPESPSFTPAELLADLAPGAALETTAAASLEALARENPDRALALARGLLRARPEHAETLSSELAGALMLAGAFPAAFELASTGPASTRADVLNTVLRSWAETDPAQARELADLLRENGVAGNVFAGLATGWALADPAGAARYAAQLPPGEHRALALQAALNQWASRDPAAVANWLPRLGNRAESESAFATLITRTDAGCRPTSTALAWAERITDAELRRTALAHVIREWFEQDPSAASRYTEATPAFTAEQRHELASSFTTRGHDG